MDVEIRNGEMGVKYKGWRGRLNPVVRRRRKKCPRSEENESSGNLNVNGKRRSMVMYKKVDKILEIYS